MNSLTSRMIVNTVTGDSVSVYISPRQVYECEIQIPKQYWDSIVDVIDEINTHDEQGGNLCGADQMWYAPSLPCDIYFNVSDFQQIPVVINNIMELAIGED